MRIPISTSFGTIRSWQEKDVGSLVKYGNNRKIWNNMRDGFPNPYTVEAAVHFLELIHKQEPVTFFAITAGDETVGAIGLSLQKDVHRFSAELAYWLGEPFWGRGWMSETVDLFCQFGFEAFNLLRIYAEPFAVNPASGRVLQKAGFNLEGQLKKSAYKNGQVLDQMLYAKINPINAFDPPTHLPV